MIQEREMIMTAKERANPDYFPKTLILREPADSEQDGSGSSSEWMGFVRDIKVSV